MNDEKRTAARLIAAALEKLLPDGTVLFSPEQLADMMETPPDPKMGDYALPCFRLSKILRKAPPIIAAQLKEMLEVDPLASRQFSRVEHAAGYLNLFSAEDSLAKALEEILNAGERYGSSEIGRGKTVVIDYSAPNIAKPFHIGHLRSTVIGQAIKNIYRFSGYECIGVNHLGDWGTQFGKLIVAYRRWGNKQDIEQCGIKALNELYVKFHKEAEHDPSLEDEARAAFADLEKKDGDCLALWRWFVDLSIAEFKKTYSLIGAEFESWKGESFYFDKTDRPVRELKEKGLLKFDGGAYLVPLDDYGMPPCLILKSDGSTIYATRDLAAAIYRAETYAFDQCIYVTSAGQSLHFAQFFKVLELMGYEWAKGLVHVPFGTVSINGEKLATRTGNIVLLEDLFADAISRTLAIIEQKNPDLPDKQEVAKQVGVGAVIFHDLSNNRIRDINFVWDEVLNFDGNTGPYVQYTYARTAGILEKAGDAAAHNGFVFSSPLENALVKTLKLFPDKVAQARMEYEPSVVSRYLLDVCADFNRFYHDCPVLKAEDPGVRGTRLALVRATSTVLKTGLALIGLAQPNNI